MIIFNQGLLLLGSNHYIIIIYYAWFYYIPKIQNFNVHSFPWQKSINFDVVSLVCKECFAFQSSTKFLFSTSYDLKASKLLC